MFAALLRSVELSRELFVSLGAPGLFAVAFLEFFLFPIPPDLVLVPLVAADPALAPVYVGLATAGSVTAGLLGFYAGRRGGRPALESRFAGERTARAEAYVDRYGLAAMVVGGFAPIPEGYELLSVAAGALGMAPRTYLVASLVGRGGKYLLEAAVVVAVGEAARSLGEIDLYAATGAATVVALAAYLLTRRWRARESGAPAE